VSTLLIVPARALPLDLCGVCVCVCVCVPARMRAGIMM
jgi:hypothetical protein